MSDEKTEAPLEDVSLGQPHMAPVSMRPDVLLFFLLEVLCDAGLLAVMAAYPAWLNLLLSSRYPVLNGIIFSAFGLGVLLTYYNFARLTREERILFRAVRASRHSLELGPAMVSLPRSGVRARLLGVLSRPERASEGDPDGRDDLEVKEGIRVSWGRYVAGVLTLLGLLGTFLGLMLAIEAMRDLLELKDFQAFFTGVVGALDGMGTAFSTSLAGICGAVVLGFQQLILHQAQSAWLGRLNLFISREVGPRVQVTEDTEGLEVEMARLRQAMASFRTDTTMASTEMRAAAQALAERTGVMAESSNAVLAALDRQEDRWRKVEDALLELRRMAESENRSLLEMVGHRMEGLELEHADVTAEPSEPGEEAAVPSGEAAADPRQLAELQRMSGLLGSIYREMALVVRGAAHKLEGSQGEMTRLIRQLIKRSDAQSANSTHQILLLRNLLKYIGKDEEQLRTVLDQVVREQEELRAGRPPDSDEDA
jgi:hypothetical protein